MTYYRAKYINGHGPYWYEVRSVRTGNGVEQQHVRYIGKNRPTSSGQGQREIGHYTPPDESSKAPGSPHVSRKWTPERRRRAEKVADAVGCSPVEADALIKRAKSKGYEYDEVDWDRLQGADLTFPERVKKLEGQVGDTRSGGEAKRQRAETQRAHRAYERRRAADGDNYDPENDLEGQYAYRGALADYEEERGARGYKSSGRGYGEEYA